MNFWRQFAIYHNFFFWRSFRKKLRIFHQHQILYDFYFRVFFKFIFWPWFVQRTAKWDYIEGQPKKIQFILKINPSAFKSTSQKFTLVNLSGILSQKKPYKMDDKWEQQQHWQCGGNIEDQSMEDAVFGNPTSQPANRRICHDIHPIQ